MIDNFIFPLSGLVRSLPPELRLTCLQRQSYSPPRSNSSWPHGGPPEPSPWSAVPQGSWNNREQSVSVAGNLTGRVWEERWQFWRNILDHRGSMIDKGFSTENHTGVRIYPISIPDKGRRKPVNTPASILNLWPMRHMILRYWTSEIWLLLFFSEWFRKQTFPNNAAFSPMLFKRYSERVSTWWSSG